MEHNIHYFLLVLHNIGIMLVNGIFVQFFVEDVVNSKIKLGSEFESLIII